jgi:hypothetical protein
MVIHPRRIVADEPLDEDFGRVIPLRRGPRSAQFVAVEAPVGIARPVPWTPRVDYPIAPRPQPVAAAAPAAPPLFTNTHRAMLGAFVVVCVSMIAIMVGYRGLTPAARPAPVAAPAPRVEAPPAPPTAAPRGSGPVVADVRVIAPAYQVVAGDTLASIAQRHGTNMDMIAAMNNLENRNSLRVGQRLVIP